MELWIRSQDKKCLTMVNHLYIDDNHHIRQQDDLILGTYETKRALEVLNEIQKVIQINAGFELYSNLGNFANEFNEKHNFVPVFQMPKD